MSSSLFSLEFSEESGSDSSSAFCSSCCWLSESEFWSVVCCFRLGVGRRRLDPFLVPLRVRMLSYGSICVDEDGNMI